MLQILILAILVGIILSRLQRRRTPLWMTFSILAVLCLPPFGLAIVSLWKDIPFSIAILGFTFCILLIVESEGEWIKRPAAWIGLGVIGVLAALYRHNGAPGVFITLGLLVAVYPRVRKYMVGAFLVAVILYLGVRGPLYQAAGVRKGSTNPGLQLALAHLIARHTNVGTRILPEERKLLASIRADDRKWPYNCYSNNPMAFDGKMNQGNLSKSTASLAQLGFQLSLRNPSETWKHLMCNSAFIFRVLPPVLGKRYSPYEASPLNLTPDGTSMSAHNPLVAVRLPKLQNSIYSFTNLIYFNKLNWFFWRNPFWMYLLIFATVVAVLRTGRRQYSLLVLPALINTLPLAFISFIQAFRLVMPVILVSLLFSGYLILRDR